MNRFSLRILSISICAQVVNEFEEQVEIEKAKAKERMSKGGKGEGVGNVSQPSVKRARDNAVEKINADVSGRSIEKGQKVKKIAGEEGGKGGGNVSTSLE